ncbi:MAG: TatD family nuclease-associated radical SAM protein [Oscillospiraceae bacterium]|nr:TatD family nuclease-associated radical SAM protein [Oscillospiraceae bacterium]
MTIFYKLADALYVNITNRCRCGCVFCIRKNGDGVGDAASLWLPREPTVQEVCSKFEEQDLCGIREIVFCGYGEPLERADDVVEICAFIKSRSEIPVRLNTNGLVSLFNPEFDITRLAIFDAVSISLNSDNAADYQRATCTPYEAGRAFAAVLAFAEQCRGFARTQFSVVAFPGCEAFWNEERCREIAARLEIPLRIRAYG